MSAVFFKEVRNYYRSASVYILSALLLFIAGIIFFGRIYSYGESVSQMSAMPSEYRGDFSFSTAVLASLPSLVSFLLLFIIPFVTMKLFSEEKKLGTLELLFTYPLTEIQLIAGKFAGCFLAVFPAILVTALLPLNLIFMKLVPSIDWGYIAAGYTGVVLFCFAAIAIGMWASTLTDNQLIAGVITAVSLVGFWIIGLPGEILQGRWRDIFSALSFTNNLESFMRGSIELSNTVFFIAITLLFLYLAYYNLSARKWRA